MTAFEFYRNNYFEVMKRNPGAVDLLNKITGNEVGSYKWLKELDFNWCFSNARLVDIEAAIGADEVDRLISEKVLKSVIYKDGFHRAQSTANQFWVSLTAKGFKALHKAYANW